MAGHYTRQANRERLAKRATERTNKAHASPHHNGDEPAPLKKISKISDLLCPIPGMAGEEGLTLSWSVKHLAQSGIPNAVNVFQEFLPRGSHRSAVAVHSACSRTKSNNVRRHWRPRPKMDAIADEQFNTSKTTSNEIAKRAATTDGRKDTHPKALRSS